MFRLTVRRHKGRAGWGARLWLGSRFLDVGWFHYKEPVLPPTSLSPEFKQWLADYIGRFNASP